MQKEDFRCLWWWSAGFGLFGAALLLERIGSLMKTTMPKIEPYVARGLPVPTAIDWHHPFSRALSALGDSYGRFSLLWWALLLASPFLLFRALQPERSFFKSGQPADGSSPLQRPLDLATALRVLFLSVVSLWLVGAWWWAYHAGDLAPVVARVIRRPLSSGEEAWLGGVYFWLRSVTQREELVAFLWLVMCGLILFVLWQGGWQPLRLLSAAARGTAVGLLGAVVLFPLCPAGHRIVQTILQSIGSTGEKLWHVWALGWLVVGAVGFMALGVTTCLLARPSWAQQQRGRLLPLSAGTLLLLALLQGGYYTQVARQRWGIGKDFHAAVFGASKPSSRQSQGRTLILMGRRYGIGYSPLVTITGVEANRQTRERVWQYLRERNFRSYHTEAAFMHLYDCAALDWDPVASLEVAFANAQHCPSQRPIFVELLVSKLSACPITPETRRFLDKLADARFFQHPHPNSRRNVGDLYWKFGDRKKAEEWFRRVPVGPRELQHIKKDPLLLTNGVVTGSIFLNGKPAAGLRVGVVPWGNRFELLGARLPFAQRFIVKGVTTDAQGRFRLDRLPAAIYALVVAAPSKDIPPRVNAVRVTNLPGIIDLGRTKPSRDVGRIEIEVDKNAPTTPPPPPPTGDSRGVIET
ncbi:MAG: carboxypeptidase-like regulatory domain-containing protein [Abditibacteriales bacterium]|nr:carboxypeptidase-like regulatory domain-containing protein [Abditibacteriales bacterium]MDW8366031.1 carboxypeptidase-like regulatory domain-containing protein [Abditibacteriales bacterium]